MKPAYRRPPAADQRNQPGKSAGSDLKARHDRALALARGCEAIGDRVEAERFYQQADHYRRLLSHQAA